jgi:hypothetical protein
MGATRIVWQDNRDNVNPNDKYEFTAVNIWMHDLTTGEDHQVTTFDGPEECPQIVGDKLYFDAPAPDATYPVIYQQDLTALGL